jgi:hypothetical protein
VDESPFTVSKGFSISSLLAKAVDLFVGQL